MWLSWEILKDYRFSKDYLKADYLSTSHFSHAGTEKTIECDMALLALGFLGPEKSILEELNLDADARSNVKTASGKFATSVPRIYAAGGRSLFHLLPYIFWSRIDKIFFPSYCWSPGLLIQWFWNLSLSDSTSFISCLKSSSLQPLSKSILVFSYKKIDSETATHAFNFL